MSDKKVNRQLTIELNNLTDSNKYEKYNELVKCLYGKPFKKVSAGKAKEYADITIKLRNTTDSVEKALRTMSLSLGVPLKAAKGEVFFYKAQEDLTDRWCKFFSEFIRDTYDYVTSYFELPKKTAMEKANLSHKGKVLYYPSTGEPIKQSDWNKFIKNLEAFLNRNVEDAGKKIILQSSSLGRILDRMLKYNTLEAVKELRLKDLEYHGKSFDWISDSTKNMKSIFGDELDRKELARIETLSQSAAMKVTNVTEKVRGEIKQVLIDGVRGRKSKSEVSQVLFDKMVGDNRDFQRVADSEVQNAFNNAFIKEEVYNSKKGEKIYFQRIEVIDDNTCNFCRSMNGKVALWSDRPLSSDIAENDPIASYVIWEGKEWNGGKNTVCLGIFHPWCRGTWVRYDDDGLKIDALIASKTGNSSKWDNAVKQAKEEFEERGIKNPDDNTQGYTQRVLEIFGGESVNKSLTYSGHKLQGRRKFSGLDISIENKKGSVRRGTDDNGHQWAIKMKYDYGYIRGTEGVDGDHVDCYLGDNENATKVYIVHQNNPDTHKYDEDKCMLGFDNLKQAKQAYLSQYDRKGFLGDITIVPFHIFKEKVLQKKYHKKRLDL